MAEKEDNMLRWASIRAIASAVVLPVFLQAALILVVGDQPWFGGGRAELFGVVSLLACTSFGFTFLLNRWRAYALVIALIYFPTLLFLLFFVSLGVGCSAYGDCL